MLGVLWKGQGGQVRTRVVSVHEVDATVLRVVRPCRGYSVCTLREGHVDDAVGAVEDFHVSRPARYERETAATRRRPRQQGQSVLVVNARQMSASASPRGASTRLRSMSQGFRRYRHGVLALDGVGVCIAGYQRSSDLTAPCLAAARLSESEGRLCGWTPSWSKCLGGRGWRGLTQVS